MHSLIRPWHKLLIIVALVLTALAGVVSAQLFGDLPAPDALIKRSSLDTTKIYDRNGKLLYEILDPRAGRRTRLPLSELPLNLQHAVLAVEDANYYDHPGVDPIGIARAMAQNLRAGQIVAGGSTITQQLARQLLLSKEESGSRSYIRKLREAILALRLTQAYSKDAILEMYLNETYFGNLAYGVEAAAHAYFGKPARELDLAESALLAGVIQSPPTYNPLVNLDAARARQQVVLDLMIKHGYLTQTQADSAIAEPLHFKTGDSTEILRAPHFVAYVRNLLEQEYGAEKVNRDGLRVVTTLDLDLQQRAEAVVKYNISELARRTREEAAPNYNLHDAALVAIKPETGEILAMVGSADYFDESIDGAVNVALANRQPGSSIKPITYATAFEQGYTPATVLSDVATTFQTKENEPYAPINYDNTWHGPISLRTALATSSNMVAVKVLDHVGLDAMIKTAKALGISTFDDSDRFGLSLTLGGGEVKLLDLTAAYAAFANQGRRVQPLAIISVTEDGRVRTNDGAPTVEDAGAVPIASMRQEGDGQHAISPQVAYLITNILSDDRARIPAFGEDSILNLSRPAAAKTGTTTDFRDNWTIGYTPELAVGVWAGNANDDPMYKISGITGAAPIWHDFMEQALRGVPPRDFVRPDGLVDLTVCEASGLLPTQYCPRIRSEVFVKGTEPQQSDDSYRPISLDSSSGLIWTNGCPGHPLQTVFRLFPADAQDWARQQGYPVVPTMNCLRQPYALRQIPDGKEAALARAALVISSPAQNSTFQLNVQIPTDLQRVEVAARLGSASTLRQVILLVDGQSIATFDAPPFRALWRLAVGEHQLKAVGIDADGNRLESEAVRIVVLENQ